MTRPWLTLVAIAFCAEGLFVALFVSPVSHGIDFYHVNFVPAAVHRGLNIYDPDQHRQIAAEVEQSIAANASLREQVCVTINRRLYPTGFCPTATPFLYAVHSLGLVGPFDLRYWIFQIAATVLGAIGIVMAARSVGLSRQIAWLACGLITSFCWPLFLDAQLANVSRFQLFGLGVAMAASTSRRAWGIGLAGFVLAVGAAYKPTILPSIVVWLGVLLVDRRWRDVVTGLAGLVLGTLLSFVFPLILFPSLDCWWEWKHFAGAELSALANDFPGNYSLQAALSALGPGWLAAIPWLIGASLLFVFGWTSRPKQTNEHSDTERDRRLALAIAVGPLWTILASPLTWVQYSALTMPLAIGLIGCAAQRRHNAKRWVAAILIAAAFSGGLVQRFFEVDRHWLDAGLLWIGWIGLFILALGVIASSKRTATRTSPLDCRSIPHQFDVCGCR